MTAATTKTMDRAAWLADRATYIGGTDVYRIVSGDALGVYLDKRGMTEVDEGNEYTEWGMRLERVILEAYAEKTGQKLRFFDAPIRHKTYPFLAANLDAEAENEYGDVRIPDAKNVSGWKAHEWGEDGGTKAPEGYVAQVMHYCYIRGRDAGDLAALIGGHDFRIIHVPYRKDVYEDLILPDLIDFWTNHVEKGIPPDPNFEHERALERIKKLNALSGGTTEVIPATDDVLRLVAAQKSLAKIAKQVEAKQSEVKAALHYLIGDHAAVAVGDTGIVLKRVDTKATWVEAHERAASWHVRVNVPKNYILPELDSAGLMLKGEVEDGE